ncbi:MAG TPA: DUF4097 family beta strand repeat-containing protein [Rhodanobacter sp.]
MRRILTAVLLITPLAAFAAGSCKYEAPRNLQLDLAGVRSVQIDVHSQELQLSGSSSATTLVLTGRACASNQSALEKLQITQRRDGDRLLLDIGGGSSGWKLFGGNGQASLEVNVQMPQGLPLTVRVGSGDANVTGVQQLHSSVGSGDLHVRNLSGKLFASVGSGDIDAADIGSLELGSVGSGDFKADGIKGDAHVGSVGSGDVVLRRVGGNVHADTLGSGDLNVRDVAGDFSLGAKGSGDVSHSGVKGKVSVPRDDY